MKKLLTFILLISWATSQSQFRQFTALTSFNGISQSEVYSFLEDSNGFMWFGTVDGLNKYDGYNIEIFNSDQNTTYPLSNNTIRALIEDKYGRIWIGTDDGLNMYDPKTEQIKRIKIKDTDQKIPIWSLYIYDNYLLAGCADGVWLTPIQEDNSYVFYKVNCLKDEPDRDNLIRVITKSKLGGVWLLTRTNISRVIIDNNKTSKLIETIPFQEWSIPISIVEDFTGNLWIASEYLGISRYNPLTKQLRTFTQYGTLYAPSSNKCSSLALDKNNNLWIGSLDRGLNFVNAADLNNDQVVFEAIKHDPLKSEGINSNLIYSLYVAGNNQLWVGTIGSGVNIFDPEQKKFKHYKVRDQNIDLTSSNFVRAVFAQSNDLIWVGTHANGLLLLDKTKDRFEQLGFKKQSIFHIAQLKGDKVLVCSSTGIYITRLINGKLEILSQHELGPVFYVEKGIDNIYWAASLHGLYRLVIVDQTIILDNQYTEKTHPSISTNNCRMLFYNSNDNTLYVGTEGGGLNIISLNNEQLPEKISVYKADEADNSISSNYIRAITRDCHQNIWIGTYNGLNKIVVDPDNGNRSFEVYTRSDGLPNNMIHLIVEDKDRLWIGTNKGLSQFIPKENKFINYTKQDGLQSNEFSEHSACKTPDGEIVIGGINGINTFYPTQIEISARTPQTIITDFYLDNKRVAPLKKVNGIQVLNQSIVLTDHIVLSPNQKQIGFKFSSMIYPNANQVQYAYMLDGFDEDWQYTNTDNRVANYTNLRHGNYKFKVKSTNTDGVWESSPKEVSIYIKTPLYHKWYAYLVYILFIIFAAKSIIRFIVYKKKLALEHSHNESLRQLDMLRIKFFINISHDLRTPLTLIREPLDVVLHNNNLEEDDKRKLELVKRNVKRLNYLVEQLLDIRKAESSSLKANLSLGDIVPFIKDDIAHFSYAINKKGLTIDFASNPGSIYANFDGEMISKVIFNILSNSIKFTSTGGIQINVERVSKYSNFKLESTYFDSYVKVEIKDTGIGIPKEQCAKILERFYQIEEHTSKGYGIGLSHTKELIDAHQGIIDIDSVKDEGTTISVYIPDIELVGSQKSINIETTEDIYIDEDSVVNDLTDDINDKLNTILIVEDNIDLLNFIKGELKNKYNVIGASDGLDGLSKAKFHSPDLIVSDIIMPNMNGVDLCMHIKSSTDTSHIPVILLTAKTDIETKYESIKTGADDYISKPFEIEYLHIRIENILKARESMRKMFQKTHTLSPSSVAITSLDEKFLNTLMKEIENAIPDSEFSIGSLESKMAMSHAQFYRKIKSLTGQSGQELLYSMRMKRAYQILSSSQEIRISEVAYMVGFTNPKYFSKCFKELYNIAPAHIRSINSTVDNAGEDESI